MEKFIQIDRNTTSKVVMLWVAITIVEYSLKSIKKAHNILFFLCSN